MAKLSCTEKIRHVAIIMDGNGRWAKKRFRPREWGHVRGARVVSEIVEEAVNLKLKALTLFSFSTENWLRPQKEIQLLFKLLHKFLKREGPRLIANEIRFQVIGDYSKLPIETQELIMQLTEQTRSCQGLKLSFAFNYGSRREIVESANRFIRENPGQLLREEDIDRNLYTHDLGDVDLLIRTSGEQRISNFLLWQISYAELYFGQTKWPDFTAKEFRKILEEVAKRDRRFGGI